MQGKNFINGGGRITGFITNVGIQIHDIVSGNISVEDVVHYPIME